MQSKFNPRKFLQGAGLLLAIGVTGSACAQVWNYQGSQNADAAGPAVMGQISLEQVGGEYKFQMQAVNLDPCYRTAMKAAVEKAPSTITITPVLPVAGCGRARFVLNSDGSGGHREFFSDGRWQRENVNRVLTLRK